jgi:transposase
VPDDHLARRVKAVVEQFDLSTLEEQYSSLGRHGYRPSNVMAVWIYASLIGWHQSTKLAKAMVTDAALRLLSGGYALSAPTLRRFRQKGAALFTQAIERCVFLAFHEGWLKPEELAVDSMRLRAEASFKAVRTLERSKQRVEELSKAKQSATSDEERERLDEKQRKHEAAIQTCEESGRTNVVLTNERAGLMKFPNAGGVPGHRVTVTAAGVRERLVVSVLIDADTQDAGKLGPSLEQTRELFKRIGATSARLQAAADAGYWTRPDLEFARDQRAWVDVLIAEAATAEENGRFFTRPDFAIDVDGNATCPAGRLMRKQSQGKRVKYIGVGCSDCALKPKCTDASARMFTVRPDYEHLRDAMQLRMSQPDAEARYQKRLATVEPVFSNIEHVMGFRRASSRHAPTVVAEILLKILAHNVSRLLAAKRHRRAFSVLDLALEF